MKKVILLTGVNVILLIGIFGVEMGLLIQAVILLYAWLGEYIALKKERVIKFEELSPYNQSRIEHAMYWLSDKVMEKDQIDISTINVCVVPTDELNAYSYGRRNVALTSTMLDMIADDTQIMGVLAHEISHSLNRDAFFNRMIFGNVILMMLSLSLVFGVITFAVVLCLSLVGCSNATSGGTTHFFNKTLELIQRFVLFAYQAIIGVFSRRFELRADQFAVRLGFGMQLASFLEQYVLPNEHRCSSLAEVLYASHPSTFKRINKIHQEEQVYANVAIEYKNDFVF